MDLCHHPEIIGLHGMTSGTKPQPQAQLRPVFSLSRTGLHSDVLVIPTEQWGEKHPEEVVKWEAKQENKLLWVSPPAPSNFWNCSNVILMTDCLSLPPLPPSVLPPSPISCVCHQRGRNTGAFYSKETPWRTFHRSRLAAMASSDITDPVTVLSAPLSDRKDALNQPTLGDKVFLMSEGKLNDRYLDVGLAYEPTR
jgi:hypothetical protein